MIEDIAELLADVVLSAKPPPEAVSPRVAAAGDQPLDAPTQIHPVAFARVEVLEAEHLVAADRNGLSDPFIRGCIGVARFNTSIKRKTLNPKWFEDFRVPILEWQDRTLLKLMVMDYDRFSANDDLGLCEIDLTQLKDGRRHDLWIRLDGAKSGKVHVAVTIQKEEEGDQGRICTLTSPTFPMLTLLLLLPLQCTKQRSRARQATALQR